jgi:bifunctional non-homologous end joining protein LigD
MKMKRSKIDTQLERYRTKRNFVRTPEPTGHRTDVRRIERPLYVVQKHAATRLHYDFRLEMDGTLKSWAVPKGPSLDPAQKRLAVHVEDHPLEYADFEGVIPPQQYGAGTVLIWDRGSWHPQGDPQESYRRGVLKFRLDGQKLHGAWTLVRMQRRQKEERDNAKENWLLIKERDEEAKTGKAGEIVETLTDSVQSGRGLKEIATKDAKVWHSNRASASAELGVLSSKLSKSKSGHRPSTVKTQNSKPRTQNVSSLTGAVKAAQPDWIAPQLATLVERMPSTGNWLHEIKYDGYRILCCIRGGKVKLYTRHANDWTVKLGAQADAIAALGVKNAWLDGEVVVFTEEGKTDFQALQNAFDSSSTDRIVYCLFDLLYLEGYDLRSMALLERKRLLSSLIGPPRADGESLLRYSDHIEGQGSEVLAEACRRGLEGIIAKQADVSYRSGRTRSWLKIKCEQRQEFVIGGFTEPAGSRRGFGALLVGYYDRNRLRFAGKVGTGFSDATLRRLHGTLVARERPDTPFVDPPTGAEARGVHWVKPDLVAEVRFSEWTKEGILRQPSFQGLRTDKSAREIVKEEPQAAPTKSTEQSPKARSSKQRMPRGSRARLTNPDRVLYPDLGLTKSDLARYYEQVEEWILPHLRGRPLTLVRCPEGYQNCFYQKHVNQGVPEAIGRVEIEEDGSRATYMVADTIEAVLGLVQMGVLELHTWGARRDRLDLPDRLTFDLDPDPSVPWIQVVEAARLTKTLLEELTLTCFLKTTGGKGLHVVVPIQRSHDWEEVKAFAKAVADHMVSTIPERFTSNMAKRARKGKIFIDYLRNARGATAIAAYSTRAKPGAPISTPIDWDELSKDLTADHFTVMNLPARLKQLRRDPWKGYDDSASRLTASMKARLLKKF